MSRTRGEDQMYITMSWYHRDSFTFSTLLTKRKLLPEVICPDDILVSSASCSVMQPHGLQPARLLCPWDSSGKNTGVGCHFLLKGIFPTWGSNPGLLQL